MTYSNYRLNCQIIYYTEWNSISSDRESRILRYISIPNKSIFQNLIAFALIKLFKALKLRRYSKLGEKTFKTDKKKIGLLLDSILFLRKNRTDKSFWRCKFANSQNWSYLQKKTYSDNKMLMIQVLLSRIYAIQMKNNNPRFILSQSGRANKAQIASQNLNRKVKKYYYTDCLKKSINISVWLKNCQRSCHFQCTKGSEDVCGHP